MQKVIAILLACFLFFPAGSFAQQAAVSKPRIDGGSTHLSQPILDAAMREARTGIAAGKGLQPTRPKRSFAGRHPVMTGALIGAGGGAAFGALVSNQGCPNSGDPGLCSVEALWLTLLVGAGVGAIIGRVISRQ